MEQLDTVFVRRGELVSMPLAEDQYPCPSTLVVNGATTNVTMATGEVGINLWLTPCGVPDPTPGSDQLCDMRMTCSDGGAGSTNVMPGVILHPDGGAVSSQVFMQRLSAYNEEMYSSFVPADVSAVWNDNLSSPFNVSNGNALIKETGTGFRTAAFGIRITYTGKLTDTEGYLDFYAPAEYESSDTLAYFSRRDPAYRRVSFGTKRTHTFFWAPNCDEIKYAKDMGAVNYTSYAANVPARMGLALRGVAEGDKFNIETICIQEFNGQRAIPTQIPRTLTPDAVHLVNTLEQHRGTHHGVDGKPGHKMSAVATGMKVSTIPWFQHAIERVPEYLKDAKHYVDVAKKGAAVVGQLIGYAVAAA